MLVAVSFLLAAAVFFMIVRHRQRKSLGSPLPDKTGWTSVSNASPKLMADDHRSSSASSGAGSKSYSKSGSLAYGVVGGSVGGGSSSVDPRSDAAQYLLVPSSGHLLNGHGGGSVGGSVGGGRNVIKTEYQEPYHALQFSPYYSYSTLLLAGSEAAKRSVANPSAGGFRFSLSARRPKHRAPSPTLQ